MSQLNEVFGLVTNLIEVTQQLTDIVKGQAKVNVILNDRISKLEQQIKEIRND